MPGTFFVVTIDDLRAELAMIDENLMRSEYTPAQQGAAVARRKVIFEELHPETRHGAIGNGREKSPQIEDSTFARFTKVTAAATGKSEVTISRAARRGKELGEDINDIVGTSLDNGQELDALCTRRRGKAAIGFRIRRAQTKRTICPFAHLPHSQQAKTSALSDARPPVARRLVKT